MAELKEAKKYIKAKTAIAVVSIALLAMIISVVVAVWPEKPPKMNVTPARMAEIPYISLHTFPDGIKQITIPIGPERWEGIALPLDAIAYDVDVLGVDDWRQIKTWDGKNGPILKKGQSAYMPIQKNSNISEATLWIRGEGESTITINR
ncbi:MAG: hypothetical protein Q8N28_03065 [bacterium]|nr:hypothetical protein [bacterium]